MTFEVIESRLSSDSKKKSKRGQFYFRLTTVNQPMDRYSQHFLIFVNLAQLILESNRSREDGILV